MIGDVAEYVVHGADLADSLWIGGRFAGKTKALWVALVHKQGRHGTAGQHVLKIGQDGLPVARQAQAHHFGAGLGKGFSAAQGLAGRRTVDAAHDKAFAV